MDRSAKNADETNGASLAAARPVARVADAHDRALVQSVAVAARILKSLASEGGALPLKRVAIATGMPRAKVHRYLASLRSAGLVAQDPESGEYRIGPAAVT